MYLFKNVSVEVIYEFKRWFKSAKVTLTYKSFMANTNQVC